MEMPVIADDGRGIVALGLAIACAVVALGAIDGVEKGGNAVRESCKLREQAGAAGDIVW